MIDRVEEKLDIKPERLIADTAYGSAEMLDWVVEQKQIEPHIPVLDKSEGKPGMFGRSDFTWDSEADCYHCPAGNLLQIQKTTVQKASFTRDQSKHDYLSLKSA